MSADSVPITPARFAAALKDLPLSSLHLKLLELRNSIAHLDYSNEQLRPYAEGTATAFSSAEAAAAAAATTTTTTTTTTEPSAQQQPPPPQQQQTQQLTPDPDCAEAIRENEEVIARMQERIRLVRAEVESRGLSWAEFQGAGRRCGTTAMPT
ncbi:34627e8b-f2c2-4524-abe1-f4479ed8da0a [Thermothielavioides terrestris]|uniref:34627e8b-f2c2-4524-abe1-f4479ed8da0a n=1 Tax=Thermothielavioides terrestris TaxID=2587410 RepID=A0A446B8R6_9PEZI|nr:34627e8b-f2c2-4524-abe1-f4479ed8da0a [Thermothielavioides terrestris]